MASTDVDAMVARAKEELAILAHTDPAAFYWVVGFLQRRLANWSREQGAGAESVGGEGGVGEATPPK